MATTESEGPLTFGARLLPGSEKQWYGAGAVRRRHPGVCGVRAGRPLGATVAAGAAGRSRQLPAIPLRPRWASNGFTMNEPIKFTSAYECFLCIQYLNVTL